MSTISSNKEHDDIYKFFLSLKNEKDESPLDKINNYISSISPSRYDEFLAKLNTYLSPSKVSLNKLFKEEKYLNISSLLLSYFAKNNINKDIIVNSFLRENNYLGFKVTKYNLKLKNYLLEIDIKNLCEYILYSIDNKDYLSTLLLFDRIDKQQLIIILNLLDRYLSIPEVTFPIVFYLIEKNFDHTIIEEVLNASVNKIANTNYQFDSLLYFIFILKSLFTLKRNKPLSLLNENDTNIILKLYDNHLSNISFNNLPLLYFYIFKNELSSLKDIKMILTKKIQLLIKYKINYIDSFIIKYLIYFFDLNINNDIKENYDKIAIYQYESIARMLNLKNFNILYN